MLQLLLNFVLLGFGVLCFTLAISFITDTIAIRKERQIEYFNSLLNINTTDILAEFSDFIFTIFESYTRLNVGVYNQYENVTAQQEIQMSKDVSELVLVSMSNHLRDKLSLVYNDMMINEIVAKNVHVFITTFVLESKNKNT